MLNPMDTQHANRMEGEPVTASDTCTAYELAADYRVHPGTIKRWHLSGRIPGVRLTSRTLRFSRAAVAAALGVTPDTTDTAAVEVTT